MVLVTARYVMPFVLAATLVLLATLPPPRRAASARSRSSASRFPIGLESIDARETRSALALVDVDHRRRWWSRCSCPTRSRLAVGSRRDRRRDGRLTSTASRARSPDILRLGARGPRRCSSGGRHAPPSVKRRPVAVRAARAMSASAAGRRDCARATALRMRLRTGRDALGARVRVRAGATLPSNIAAGSRRARHHARARASRSIGPHAESYWARTGRLHIVASVPRNRVADVLAIVRARSRTRCSPNSPRPARPVAIAYVGVPDVARPTVSWTHVKYHGWIRRLLARPARR